MEIVGGGFVAQHLHSIASRHEDTVAFAAGVSWTRGVSADSFEREAQLLSATLQRCRAAGQTLLFFSTASASIYGALRPGRESDPPIARSPYGAHKLALERRVIDSGADHLVLRLSHLVGPAQPAHQLLPTLVRAVRSGRIEVQRQATRDVLGVRDAVTLIDQLLVRGTRNQIVNVASGHSVPVEQVIDYLAEVLGCAPVRRYLDVGTRHLVSIERLAGLLPLDEYVRFGPSYYRSALAASLIGVPA
jgi:nucleoside-diphosphate-sugar epimerase